MREYSAISVSASDANSLADRLTEQSRGGWDLVKIIAADHNVVAYLSREAGHGGSGTDSGSTSTPATSSGSTAGGSSATTGSSDDSATSPSGYGTPIIVTESAVATDAGVSTDTAAGTIDNAGNAYVVEESRFEAADATPGWGSTTGANAASSGDDQASQSGSQAPGTGDQASSTASTSADGSGHASSSDTSATDSSASSTSSGDSSGSGASGGLAPAGWYADPAERFDLRYWDGSQWTEHVARGGQQDTDPPQR